MSIPKLRAWVPFSILVFGLALAVQWSGILEKTEDSFVKPSGAFRALNTWAAQRDYPFEVGKDQSFFEAWQKTKTIKKAGSVGKQSSEWKPLGPQNLGGRTLALAMHPTNPERMFAGSASGGLWRSESGGMGENAWQRVETGFPILGVATIEFNPANPDEIYIGTGEVYGFNPTAPGIGTRLTRGSYGMGIIKSEDGGKSWFLSLDWRYHQRRGIQDIAFSADASRIWAATTHGVWVSEDKGVSWQQSLNVPMATSLNPHPNNAGEVIVGCGGFDSADKGIYHTENHGSSWTKIAEGVPDSFLGKIILDRAPSDPNIVYASVGHRNDAFGIENQRAITWLLRSNNGGRSWVIQNTTDYASYQGWYSHFVKVYPDNPNHILVGGLTFYESTDAGQTFLPQEYTVEEAGGMVDLHACLIHPSNSRVYIAADQGIYTSTDLSTFLPAMHGYQTSQFYRGTAQASYNKNLLIGTPQDRLAVIYEGSMNWTPARMGHEGGYTVFHSEIRDRYLIGIAHLLGLDRVGHPENVQPVPVPRNRIEDYVVETNFNAPLVAAPSQPDLVYAGRKILYRSQNFGTTWNAQSREDSLDGNPIGIVAVSPTDSDYLYLATTPRVGPMNVYRSSDGGQNFTPITAGLPDRWPTSVVIHPSDQNIVYLTFSGFGTSHVFRSSNGGDTWEDIDQNQLPDVPFNSVFLDPDYPDHLYLASDLGAFVSLDAGQSWMSFNLGLPEAVFAVDFVSYQEDRTLRLVTHGNGVYETALLDPEPFVEVKNRLVYPWVSVNEGLFESTLVVNNLADVTALVTMTARRQDGTQEVVQKSIKPRSMLVESAASLFKGMGSGPGFSVVLESSVKDVHGRWVTKSLLAASGGSPSQGVAIAIPEESSSGNELVGNTVLFSYLPTTPEFISAPVMVNLGDAATTIDLTFYDAEGNQTAQTTLENVQPLTPVAALASNWLPAGQNQAMMKAESQGQPLTGVSFVFNDVFKETAIGNATAVQAKTETSGKIVFPWVSNTTEEYRSVVVLNNLDNQPTTVTLTARREDGTEQTVNQTIPANGFLAKESNELFDQMGSGSGMCVTATVNHTQVFGLWVTRNLRSASGGSPSLGVGVRQFNGATSGQRFGDTILLGYLPANQDMIAAPVIVNMNDQPLSITLDFVSGDGQLLFRDKSSLANIQGYTPFARVVSQVLPGVSQDVFLIAHTEDQPITGVAFVFNQGFFEPAIGNAQTLNASLVP